MNNQYADIIIDISHEKVDKPFQYKIPKILQETLEIGMSVMVPFGASNKLWQGYVVNLTTQSNYDLAKMKAIHTIIEDGVGVEQNQIRLASVIRRYFGGTMRSEERRVGKEC